MSGALALVVAYFLGGIPFGYLLVRIATGRDVRESGSGNIGATNVLRTTSSALGFATLLLDIAKGFAAVWLAAALTNSPVWESAAAFAVMVGHAFPAVLRFRGGKAVASFVGAYLYLAPVALAVALGVFVLVVWRTRFISLGSICAAAALPPAVWIVLHPPVAVVIAAAASAALIIWRHKENIARLRQGTENTFSLKRKGRKQ
ncbi:MAG: glycerol-3-phosphate 1-O-acyltransferase PlsY [bacterium]